MLDPEKPAAETQETPAPADQAPAGEPAKAAETAPADQADGQQQPEGGSFEEQVAAAVAAAQKPAGGEEAGADGEGPKAATAEAKPSPEGEKTGDSSESGGAEAEKSQDAKPAEGEKPGDLAKRLAMVAAGQRKNEVRAQELDAREAKLKPLATLAERIQSAGGSRVGIIRELLGGEDALQDFYAGELTDHISGKPGETKPAKPAKPAEQPVTAEKLQQLVQEGIRTALQEMATKDLETHMAQYADHALATLEQSATKFPHTFSSPPTKRAITDISEAERKRTGTVPSVEAVLEIIENFRKERFEKSRPSQTSAAAPHAAAPGPSKTSAEKPSSVRNNSVPVVPPRALSFDEEVEKISRQASSGA